MRKGAVAAALLLAAAWAVADNPVVPDNPVVADTSAVTRAKRSLSLSGAWALYPLAVRWQEEFQKTHPGVAVDVQAGGAGKGIADVLAGVVDIGMVSRAIYPAETARGAVVVAVAKDAVVATINAKNPRLEELLRSGLGREALTELWMRGSAKTWEALLAPGGGGGANPRPRLHPLRRLRRGGNVGGVSRGPPGGPGRRRRLWRPGAGRGRSPRSSGHRFQQRQLCL